MGATGAAVQHNPHLVMVVQTMRWDVNCLVMPFLCQAFSLPYLLLEAFPSCCWLVEEAAKFLRRFLQAMIPGTLGVLQMICRLQNLHGELHGGRS